MAEMLLAKGQQHEDMVLADYEADGKSIFHVPERAPGEGFEAWVSRVGNPMADGWDVIYQLPMIHDGVRGIADFIVRTERGHEAVDAKLARREAKPGHVLQLCFYAEALEALVGQPSEFIHLELGSGELETIRLDDVAPYWRRVRGQLVRALAAAPDADTVAEPCTHCNFCRFHPVCDAEWRAADSLVFVAGTRTADRTALVDGGVETMAALAAGERVRTIDSERLDRLVGQARLQVESRRRGADAPPAFELLAPADLPAPAPGDVFLDFEGHPFWTPEAGLFFLFGLIEQSGDAGDGEWTFVDFWAHDRAEEADATERVIMHLRERHRRFPGMHVYHYNHTERSALQRLTTDHGVAEIELERLLDADAFVDLFPVVTAAVRLGAESYSLKDVERLTGYERGHDIDQGAGAVVEYERWMRVREQSMLDRIAAYNDDDVRATRAVRDWLVAQRPTDVPWRVDLEPEVRDLELDDRIVALHDFGIGAPEHLMGDLLGYWRREHRVLNADTFRLSTADPADQLESRSAIAGLKFVGFEDQFTAKGKQRKWPAAVFTYPEQALDAGIDDRSTLVNAIDERIWQFAKVVAIDRELRELRVDWNDKAADAGPVPTSFVLYSFFNPASKLDALKGLADELLAGSAAGRPADRVGHRLLRQEPPPFSPGTSIDQIRAWATALDTTVVPVQGPPGTGKTFTGAHIVHALVQAGKRVGIVAMSHHAVDNLMRAVVERFEEEGDIDDLRAVRRAEDGRLTGVSFVNDNQRAAVGPYDVLGGTAWFFSSQVMRDNPVDVLIVDEAGQLGLADTLAASISADSLVLLGDPQQLPQVSQAVHPNDSGASALGHLLQGAATIAPEQGVFLDTTWRMHPDVSSFISDVTYESRLRVHPSCEVQDTEVDGTGLRWLRAEGGECSTESRVEAELIAAKIRRLMNTPWTDQNGVVENLRPKDFMVVAPYNDQVRRIRDVFSSHKRLAKVEVGTVDKFQGREAAVVFFSMTSSSSAHMPRDAAFLFSRHRLNVAISRARCLAYLVSTEQLLSTRATSVDEMRMLGALCAFVERAT
jgi:uncharacterized protein